MAKIEVERDIANESKNYLDNVQKRINLIIIRFDKNHRSNNFKSEGNLKKSH